MPPLKTSALEMVKNARARIEEIETSDLITMIEGCCQTNEPKHQYLVDCFFYEITKERHSVSAASRFNMNVLRL